MKLRLILVVNNQLCFFLVAHSWTQVAATEKKGVFGIFSRTFRETEQNQSGFVTIPQNENVRCMNRFPDKNYTLR